MHESHIVALASIITNLDKAIFDRESVIVGGGAFGYRELLALKLAAAYVVSKHPGVAYAPRVNAG